ncbi:MAG: type II secretion system F family protein [Phycisphaeraceae bacterium]|nr:type II secretion system F family protein [Phycisphaeraceae bacterium]
MHALLLTIQATTQEAAEPALTTSQDIAWLMLIALTTWSAVFVFVQYGWAPFRQLMLRYEARYDRVLNRQLLLNIPPRVALIVALCLIVVPGALFVMFTNSLLAFIPGALLGAFVPPLVLRHMETKRRIRLEQQLVDGITTLASGQRAGLNLVQSMELLVENTVGPIRQEFAQLLREYAMGMDLNQAMRSAANRIGLQNYRLLFTAIEMHRLRGGDAAESLDRIAESIREIQRLEGKLDAVTAQGRSQARMMAMMPFVVVGVLLIITPDDTRMLFTEPTGRLLLLLVVGLIFAGFWWIRNIMSVDI